MIILKYTNQLIQLQSLLMELQEYLVSVDVEQVQTVYDNFGEKYSKYLLQQINKNEGIIFLALSNNDTIGMIAGYIEPKDEEDYISNRCPKRGIISDLVVTSSHRGKGVGRELMKAIENFFSEQGCEFIAVNVFGPNKSAQLFYDSLGFSQRNIEYYKKTN